ncbi:hypothetical protein [Empedobacter sp. 189-2]|uniref:hypothetical protein n=1 Tax=Empedobacter sp. 189-2 TaxID=2746724 RepID=UPI00257493E1|nr:hypothetical protein [Empedobacter sp. 189-2]MDM1544271.1 hypothetical protein [Empedobacter sp. 189-2]
MIKVKHPLEQKNINQENFIQSISENEREYHELLFSYGNAVYIYHSLDIEPTLQDYEEWLDGLDEVIRLDMENKGFEKCKMILSFTRYVRERKDIGMEEFVKEKMGIEEYEKYQYLLEK